MCTKTLEAVKGLLGLSGDESHDWQLSEVIAMTEAMVLNYINHPALPDGLEPVLAAMVAGYVRSAGLLSGSAAGAQAAGPVRSVKRGDVTVAFQASGSSGSTGTGIFSLGEGSGFMSWRPQLEAFRRLP